MPAHSHFERLKLLTAEYDFTQCVEDRDDAVFCSLQLTLSEISATVKRTFRSGTVPTLFIFADTLVIDEPFLPSTVTTIVARTIIINDETPLVTPESNAGICAIQLLTQRLEGGPLLLVAGVAATAVPVVLDGAGPESIRFIAGEPLTRSRGAMELLDLLRHPMAWNSVKASFAAAALLSERNPALTSEENNQCMRLGINILRWIYQCCTLIGSESSAFQLEATDLAYQASALMVLTGADNAAPYVPVLSADFYQDRVAGLLTVVESYEESIHRLNSTSDIKQAVRDIAATVKNVGAGGIKPIQVAIDNTVAELGALQKQYDTLTWQFVLQRNDVNFKRVLFQTALEQKQFWDAVKVVFDLIQAVVEVAMAVGSLAAAPEATVGLAGGAMKSFDSAISLLTRALDAGASLDDAVRGAFAKMKHAAEQMKKFQESMGGLIKSSKTLYELAQKGASTLPKIGEMPDLATPDWAEIATMDPIMEWNIFSNAVETSMKKYVDDKVGGAAKYLMSLKTLIEYGKAINGKAVAVAQLQARFLELQAQKIAVQMAEQRWKSLETSSIGDQQKLAALSALLSQHSMAAKRALLISSRSFGAAFQYRWLRQSPLHVSLEMNATELNSAFVRIRQGLEELLSGGAKDQEFDTGFIELPVRRVDRPESAPAAGNGALLLMPNRQAGRPEATLSWSVPIDWPFFRGAVPEDGNMAFFIEEGWFHLVGAKPNSRGNIVLKIGTSGQLSNGFGKFGAEQDFVAAPSKTQEMDFIYTPKGNDAPEIRTPWRPAADVKSHYMRPSPFTQWTARIMDADSLTNISAIKVRLKGFYHSAERAAEHADWSNINVGGANCLKKLGELAVGKRMGVSLPLAEQEDRTFMWKASTVHPLQVRENTYQRIVRHAGDAAHEDPIKAQSETLSRFFIQNPGQPECFRYESLEQFDGEHLASVRMNHLIDSFYLFRLLVSYQANSNEEIDEGLRADLSGDLTKLLHNGDKTKMAWLSDWLTCKIAELGEKVNALNTGDKNRFIFFLKGGRALNFFLGTPEKGENDWDTQVVIDPNLPADEWYRCLSQVHDVLLIALKTFKTEFTTLVEQNAAGLADYLSAVESSVVISEDEDDNRNETGDVDSLSEHASCKAELIDIGLPRRDSASALEEWAHLSVQDALLTSQNGVVYPHREYYINEYLMMIRDVFLPGAEVRKAPKRILRLGLILKSERGTEHGLSATVRKHLAALPKSAGVIEKLPDRGRRELFSVIISQFVAAYNLLQDLQLAEHFDQKCAASITSPPPLPTALAELLDDAQKITASDIGVAHELSSLMDNHWKSRDEFFREHNQLFTGCVRDLFLATSKDLKNVKAQFAVAGSFAARLQADHLRQAPEGLEPIRRVLVKLQCAQGSNFVEVMGAVRNTLKNAPTVTSNFTVTEVDEEGKQTLLLYWKSKEQIGEFSYAPLVMKIRVAEQKASQLPVLASIDGIPVLDLRYLVADYLRKTSKIDESGARRVLAAATAATTEMLSKFDFDSDDAG